MAQKILNIEIATPRRKYSIGQAKSCSAPGVLGRFQVLPSHTAFISQLEIGELKIEMPQRTHFYAVSGGFLEVLNDQVLLLLDTAEPAEEIDIQRAREAKDRAEKRLQDQTTPIDVVRAEAALQRALNRLKVAQKTSTSV